ncbi:MAG: TylF/MycF/NovP-related O-methyltransferase [Pseudomonadota bacterium]
MKPVKFVRSLLRKIGVDVVRYDKEKKWPYDFEKEDIELFKSVQNYTMTSPERVYALENAVSYLVKNNIPGAMVECGVWKGGSSMVIAKTLLKLKCVEREIYLYDTFEGMSAPTSADICYTNIPAQLEFSEKKYSDNSSSWCYACLDEVKSNIYNTGYPKDKVHFVKGKVENTIPATIPTEIALLRLDTDWYESTKHELDNLFPRLVEKGVVIIDDYGYWQGAKKAVDEYIEEKQIPILLNRIDHTGRIAIKLR